MVRELVGERDLATGVALQSAAFNIARVIGPLVGGVIYASLGPAWCFFTNGASFAAILIALALVRPAAQARSEDETFWASFRQGIAQVRTNARMRAVVALTAATSLCAFSVYGTLMPALAKDRLGMHDRDTGYGLLFAAVGLGSLVAVWLVDRFANEGRRGRLMVYGAGAFGLSLIVLSTVQSVAAAMVALAMVGLASVSQLATANTLTQTLAPEALRGRAVATHMFALGGLQPLGAFLAGIVAQSWGVPVALAGGGACLLMICVLVVLLRPDLARLE
jgi:MFS family permease